MIGIGIGVPYPQGLEGAGGVVPPSGPENGILLETGTDFLLAEDGNYITQE